MKVNLYRPTRTTKCALFVMLVILVGLCVTTQYAVSQVRYAYFPTAGTTDGRFLSIAGSGIQTLGNTIMLRLASPSNASAIRIGIFDGETGGTWDLGTTPLEYTLFADPLGDGSGTFRVAQWNGSSMPDNAWFSATVTNPPQAKNTCGDFFYILRVRSTDASVTSWSNFKVRTDGSISALARVPITYNSPMNSAADAQIIYPSYPALTPTTYDGTWKFFVELQTPASSFTMWDGDLDYGSYDCSFNDTDDPDTPNDGIMTWMQGTAARAEGVAEGGVSCSTVGGVETGGMTTSNPPDDSRQEIFRRSPAVTYRLIAPNGLSYANNNPSGNLEWEQFRLSTEAFDANTMDYQVTSLPVGFYEINISGVDLSNLNAFRFLQDALGVDSTGAPVSMPICAAIPVQGIITGAVSFDGNRNRAYDAGEVGIKNVKVYLDADYNSDGAIDETTSVLTDDDGMYIFGELPEGKYKVRIGTSTLPEDVDPSYDFDGVSTPHVATTTITATQTERVVNFGYTPDCAPGTATVSYWKCRKSEWPVSSLTLGDRTYNQTQLYSIMNKSSRDNTYGLAQELIAAKFNMLMGNDGSCIIAKIKAGDDWLRDNPIGEGASRSAWCKGDPIMDKLSDYNRGYLCAKSRDRVYCGRDRDRDRWCRDSNDDKCGKPKWWSKCKDRDDRNDDDDYKNKKCRDLLNWRKFR